MKVDEKKKVITSSKILHFRKNFKGESVKMVKDWLDIQNWVKEWQEKGDGMAKTYKTDNLEDKDEMEKDNDDQSLVDPWGLDRGKNLGNFAFESYFITDNLAHMLHNIMPWLYENF